MPIIMSNQDHTTIVTFLNERYYISIVLYSNSFHAFISIQ